MYLPLKRKLQSTTGKWWAAAAIAVLLIVWQLASSTGLVEGYLLPSPVSVVKAFIHDFPLLMENAAVTLNEAFLGLFFGVILGFLMAVLMDRFERVYQAFYPLVVLTQTIPTVAIAPLLVLWFGYEMTPKVILVVLTTFFPITVGLLEGFRSADTDAINLLRSMGASRLQIFWHIKFPGALGQFFASLRISASYAVVYMTRVKKAYAFDKMFAVIFLISIISLLLMWGVDLLQKKCMPWEKREDSAK